MAGTKLGGVTGGALLLAVFVLAALTGSVAATEPQEVLEVRFSGDTLVRGTETNLRAGSEEELDRVSALLAEIGAVEVVSAGPRPDPVRSGGDRARRAGSFGNRFAQHGQLVPAFGALRHGRAMRWRPSVHHPWSTTPPAHPNRFLRR